MYETKNDPLEQSFAGAEDIAALKAGMADLKAKLDGAAIAAGRPALSGTKADGRGGEARRFVDHYLRGGNTVGIEVKAVDGAANATGGYAVPREIDAVIDTTLVRIDAALHPVAETLGDDDPPASPVPGQCWIVGTTPTGAWSGQAGALAAWTNGGWRLRRGRAGDGGVAAG